jgi:DNA (cytosine-5)-methyltransferase 1
MSIRTNSYFSGAGLMDLGLQRGGLHVQESYEIDETCCETLRQNFDHKVVQMDVSKKLVFDESECDAMVATFPCTKYSTAADINGARTGDELFLHFFRHVAIRRPEVYAVENVPGMRKFPVVMEALTRLPDYYVNVFCPVSSTNWLPQKRDRLIIIGSRKRFGWRPPEAGRVLTLAEIIEENPQVEIPDYVYARINGKYRDQPIVSDPAKGDVAPTCVAHYAKDLGTRLVVDRRYPHGVRPYSVREYARLQGLPDTFTFAGTSRDAYRMIGNGVSVPVGEWLGREIVRYFGRGARPQPLRPFQLDLLS